jgi:hypothetical protein
MCGRNRCDDISLQAKNPPVLCCKEYKGERGNVSLAKIRDFVKLKQQEKTINVSKISKSSTEAISSVLARQDISKNEDEASNSPLMQSNLVKLIRL